MYKLLIVVALAVACMAEPEANPEAYRGRYLGGYGHAGYALGGYGRRGHGYAGYGRRGYGHAGYGHAGFHKRSADAEAEAEAAPEAEAEADPAYLYGGAYNVAPYAATYAAAPVAYTTAAYAPYAAYSTYAHGLAAPAVYGGAHFIGKREAEAAPEAEAEADPAYLYGGAYNVAPYAATYAAAPVAYTTAAYAPYGLAAPAVYGGAHFIGKREAEPIFGKLFKGHGRRRVGHRGRYFGYRG